MQPQPLLAELSCPSSWASVDFISDLHLQAAEPATFAAWQHYMHTTPADAVFILGDLFEVWVGDDLASSPSGHFEAQCMAVLRSTAQAKPVYFLPGNRDFLIGDRFLAASHMRGMQDPLVLTFRSVRYLLSHGDAQCLADTDYMQFRALVRSPQWQHDFLAKPLATRLEIASQLRAQSEARKHRSMAWIDLDASEIARQMQEARAQHMVHGHTHQRADHPLPPALQPDLQPVPQPSPQTISPSSTPAAISPPSIRYVLSDWDASARPPRLQVLRLDASGMQRVDLADAAAGAISAGSAPGTPLPSIAAPSGAQRAKR